MFKVEVHKADAWLRSSEVLTSGSSKAYKAKKVKLQQLK